jgi:hypothetical protein
MATGIAALANPQHGHFDLTTGALLLAAQPPADVTCLARNPGLRQTVTNSWLNRSASQGRRPNAHALPEAMTRHTGILS